MCKGREEVPSQGVRVAFFMVGDVRLELIEPTSGDSAVSKYLEKNGEGLHHVAFETDDIVVQLQKARDAGCRLVNETLIEGAGRQTGRFSSPQNQPTVFSRSFVRKTAKNHKQWASPLAICFQPFGPVVERRGSSLSMKKSPKA